MNISIVTPQMVIGGAETYVLFKSKWLAEHGHNVTVISASGENVINLDSRVKFIEYTTEVSAASFSREAYNNYLQELGKLIIDSKADVVEVHNTSPVVHVAMSYKYHKTPFLVNILNEMSYKHNPFLRSITRKINKYSLMYVPYAPMQRFIEKNIGQMLNAKLIYLPVQGIDQNNVLRENIILTVGRLASDKRYIIPLIDGFTALMLQKRLPDNYRLHIVGDGEKREIIKSKVLQSNNSIGFEAIQMMGMLHGNDVIEQYRKAKLFVGTGTSMLLSASCGLPAILPGYTDDTINYGWGIWGENPSDIDTTAITISEGRKKETYADLIYEILVNDPLRYNSASTRAKLLFEQNYSTDLIMQEWINEYKRVSELKLDGAVKEFDITELISLWRPIWKIRNLLRK